MRAWSYSTLLVSTLYAACPAPVSNEHAPDSVDAAAAIVEAGTADSSAHDVQFLPRDAGSGCGDVGLSGYCDPSGVLFWCENNTIKSVACHDLELDCALNRDLGGYWCLADVGESCRDWPCHEQLLCGHSQRCVGANEDAGTHDSFFFDGTMVDGNTDILTADMPQTADLTSTDHP